MEDARDELRREPSRGRRRFAGDRFYIWAESPREARRDARGLRAAELRRPVKGAVTADPWDERILVGVDFAPASRAALARAVDLARDRPAELHVLHVMVAGPGLELPGTDSGPVDGALARRRRGERRLERWVRESGAGPAGVHLFDGAVRAVLPSAAAGLGASRVLLGAGRRSSGGLASHVRAATRCPVEEVEAP
jgi:nucleotide-binding universal stress UspA family protein